MTVIKLPALGNKSALAWHALFDLSEKVPSNWCLVGGQMVHAIIDTIGSRLRLAEFLSAVGARSAVPTTVKT